MIRFALLSLYRSLTRHKLYAALDIGGLAIGIAVFLVLFRPSGFPLAAAAACQNGGYRRGDCPRPVAPRKPYSAGLGASP